MNDQPQKKWASDLPKPVTLKFIDLATAKAIGATKVTEREDTGFGKGEIDGINLATEYSSLIEKFFAANNIIYEKYELGWGDGVANFSVKDEDSIRKLAVAGFQSPALDVLKNQEARLREATQQRGL